MKQETYKKAKAITELADGLNQVYKSFAKELARTKNEITSNPYTEEVIQEFNKQVDAVFQDCDDLLKKEFESL